MSIGWGHARTYARTCTYIGGLHVNWVGLYNDMHVHVGRLSMCGRIPVV